MFIKKYRLLFLPATAVLLGVMIFTGSCSKKPVNSDLGNVPISMKIKSPASRVFDQYLLTVTAPDIVGEITTPLMFQDGYLIIPPATQEGEGSLDIPAGRDRLFTVEVIDEIIGDAATVYVTVYRGSATANVLPDAPVVVDLVIRPVVPMIRLSPKIQTVNPLQTFSVTVKAYNMPLLAGASLHVTWLDRDMDADSVRMGGGLNGSNIYFSAIENDGFQYGIEISQLTAGAGLLGDDGAGDLAEIFLSARFYNPDTVYVTPLTLEINEMTDAGNNIIYINDYYYKDDADVTVDFNLTGDRIVTFADPALEALVRAQIYKPTGDLYLSDVYPITDLSAGEHEVINLTGISNLVNLSDLELSYSGDLGLANISGIEGLRKLTYCNFAGNNIAGVQPLAALTTIAYLDLSYNEIVDLSPLSNLTNLSYLHLESNNIVDIQPLVDNEGLGEGDYVSLDLNPLSTYSIDVLIPILENRNVIVSFYR